MIQERQCHEYMGLQHRHRGKHCRPEDPLSVPGHPGAAQPQSREPLQRNPPDDGDIGVPGRALQFDGGVMMRAMGLTPWLARPVAGVGFHSRPPRHHRGRIRFCCADRAAASLWRIHALRRVQRQAQAHDHGAYRRRSRRAPDQRIGDHRRLHPERVRPDRRAVSGQQHDDRHRGTDDRRERQHDGDVEQHAERHGLDARRQVRPADRHGAEQHVADLFSGHVQLHAAAWADCIRKHDVQFSILSKPTHISECASIRIEAETMKAKNKLSNFIGGFLGNRDGNITMIFAFSPRSRFCSPAASRSTMRATRWFAAGCWPRSRTPPRSPRPRRRC